MNKRTILLFLSLVFFTSLPLATASKLTNAERQAAIDYKRYQPAAYQSLLDTLRRIYPDYSEDSIVAYVFWAYEDLKKHFSNVTIYQAMSGIVEFSQFMQQKDMSSKIEGPQRLEKIISSYLAIKEEESKKIPKIPAKEVTPFHKKR